MIVMKHAAARSSAKGFLIALLLGAATATPAAAQVPDGSASQMILELQQMREELRELRGLVEAQAQEIENLKRRQRDQYVDLDRRLGNLGPDLVGNDSDDAVARQSEPGPGIDAGPRPEAPEPEARGIDLPEVRAPVDPEPEIVTLADPGESGVRQLREPTQGERQAYDQAFQALRETRYADAAEAFDRFLQDHPDSAYAPNAMYWLGEVYYVTRDFETALAQFRRLHEAYPDSSKKPDALLKVGFSHYELGQWQRARAALEQVVSDYPASNYSRLAENRLRTMRLEGNL